MTLLSFGGAHLAIITCIAGNDTPYNKNSLKLSIVFKYLRINPLI